MVSSSDFSYSLFLDILFVLWWNYNAYIQLVDTSFGTRLFYINKQHELMFCGIFLCIHLPIVFVSGITISMCHICPATANPTNGGNRIDEISTAQGLCLGESLLGLVSTAQGLCWGESLLGLVSTAYGLCWGGSLLGLVSTAYGLCWGGSLLGLVYRDDCLYWTNAIW